MEPSKPQSMHVYNLLVTAVVDLVNVDAIIGKKVFTTSLCDNRVDPVLCVVIEKHIVGQGWNSEVWRSSPFEHTLRLTSYFII
jgi:hypothetical protein